MDPGDLLATVPATTAALVKAAESAGLDASVPGCPGWSVETLVHHVGDVHRWVARLVGEHASRPGPAPRSDHPPAGPALFRWLDDGAAELVSTCSAEGPDAPVWNMAGAEPATAAFWFRRMAHETLVHQWDAASAISGARSGAPQLDPVLAADGIDEYLTMIVPSAHGRSRLLAGLTGSVHVHCSDTSGEWQLDIQPDALEVRREHAKGDVALRGPASGLLLVLLNRLNENDAGVEIFGDASLVAAWHDLVRF